MYQEISMEVLAVSLHVAAASALVTNQTIHRMELLTNSVLKSVELCHTIAHTQLQELKRNQLHTVIEEHEEDLIREPTSSNTRNYKDSIIEEPQNVNWSRVKQSLQDIILQDEKENDEPNRTVCTPKSYTTHSSPQQEHPKLSVLSQQLSQIKVDKLKEQQDNYDLMKIVEETDPDQLIPKISNIEVINEKDRSSVKKSILIFPSNEQFVAEPEQIEQLAESPEKQEEWYRTSDVQYRATSYNTNESSNLDHHSYKWLSHSAEEEVDNENLFADYDMGMGFPSSVFDFPFPKDFNENSIPYPPVLPKEENQFTPKKKRLLCNQKKVPHWAEDLNVVCEKQQAQQNMKPEAIFGRMGERVLKIAKTFTDNKNSKRGSSAKWDQSQRNFISMQNQLKQLEKLQSENFNMLNKQDSIKKNVGFLAKTQFFLSSMKKKIFSSMEKEYKQ